MDPYLGEIRIFGGTYAPHFWAYCAGQIVSIAEYNALFSLIGTTYGGDGQSSFGLPNLSGRLVCSRGQHPGSSHNYQLGQPYGYSGVALTIGQMPSHNHNVQAATQPANTIVAHDAVYAALEPPAEFYADSSASGFQRRPMWEYALNETGGTPNGGVDPHTNIMPCVAISFIICMQGLYPSSST